MVAVAAVVEQFQQRFCVRLARECCLQAMLAVFHFWPGRIKQVIRQPVDARRHLLHRTRAAGETENAVDVADEDVKAVVARRLHCDFREVCARLLVRRQKVAHQPTARGRIDFALAPDGAVLLFEANATMALVPPAPAEIWDYRRAAIDTALQAARRMLESRTGIAKTVTAPRV